MAPTKKSETPGENSAFDPKIKTLLDNALVNQGKAISPNEAMRMIEWLQERGRILGDTQKAIAELAQKSPIIMYEKYVDLKLAELNAKQEDRLNVD